MRQVLQIDNVEYWHDVVCAHLLRGECSRIGPDFKVHMSLSHAGGIQLTRIGGSGHTFSRREKHIRDSSADDLALLMPLSGTLLGRHDGREATIGQGEVTCADGTRPGEMVLSPGFELLLVQVPRPIVLSSLGPTERYTACNLNQRTSVAPLLASFLQTLGTIDEGLSFAALSRLTHTAVSLILTTLADASSKDINQSTWGRSALLYRAEEFIHANYRRHELTSSDVASAMKVSIRYLQEIFQELAQTPSGYIWQCRLKGARQDLENPLFRSMSIGEIAIRNGFAEAAHFGRRFRDAFGTSPREFRSSALKDQPLRIRPGVQ